MPQGRIDDVVGEGEDLLPEIYAYMAASAADAASDATTSFDGIFVDAAGMAASREGWEVVHARSIDVPTMARYRKYFPRQYHVEQGAIAVVAAVLHMRDGLRLDDVSEIGERSDYALRDRRGDPAGVIEIAGLSAQYTSTVAEKKRTNVKLSVKRPARIGIVAFGGPELRSEVVA